MDFQGLDEIAILFHSLLFLGFHDSEPKLLLSASICRVGRFTLGFACHVFFNQDGAVT